MIFILGKIRDSSQFPHCQMMSVGKKDFYRQDSVVPIFFVISHQYTYTYHNSIGQNKDDTYFYRQDSERFPISSNIIPIGLSQISTLRRKAAFRKRFHNQSS